MRNLNIARFYFIAMIAGLTLLTPNKLLALEQEFTAAVELREVIKLTEQTPLNFGTIIPPSSGNQDFTIETNGNLSTTGTGSFVSGQSAGAILATGEDVAFSASALTLNGDGDCTVPGVTLNNVAPSSATTLDTTIAIGGVINVTSGVFGSGICKYTVTANYL